MRISGFGSRQAKFLMWDHGKTSRQAHQLEDMGICRSNCSHKTNSTSHTISKVSMVIHISAVVDMGIKEGIDDTHHYNSILKASQENLGNQVVKKMASPWQKCSVPPNRGEKVVQERAFVVV